MGISTGVPTRSELEETISIRFEINIKDVKDAKLSDQRLKQIFAKACDNDGDRRKAFAACAVGASFAVFMFGAGLLIKDLGVTVGGIVMGVAAAVLTAGVKDKNAMLGKAVRKEIKERNNQLSPK